MTVVFPNWPRERFAIGAAELAQDLLGAALVHTDTDGSLTAGIIVETEAYIGAPDAASHAYQNRRTRRNAAMFGPPGFSYVFFTYGMHYCFNVVCSKVDDPQAVLIRALEPVAGLARMRNRRWGDAKNHRADHQLCSGPAKLCQALGITRQDDGRDLCAQPGATLMEDRLAIADVSALSAYLEVEPSNLRRVARGPRIGVEYAGVWAKKPLRFFFADHAHVSLQGPRLPSKVRPARPGKSKAVKKM